MRTRQMTWTGIGGRRLGGLGGSAGSVLPAPSGFVANAGNNTVQLTWNSVTGATSYNVYRGTTSGGESLLATGATSPYDDNTAVNGTTYYYQVAAVNSMGVGTRSSEQSATPIFDPTTISGLTLWVKGDSGTWQDSGLTTPATANNDPVGGWSDASGNSNDLVQATSGLRPKLVTSSLNGRNGVLFTIASTTYLRKTHADIAQPTTLYMVMKETAVTTAGQTQTLYDSVSGSGENAFYMSGAASPWRMYAGSFATAGTADTSPHYFGMTWTGASSVFRVDGASTSVNPGTGGLAGGWTLGTDSNLAFFAGATVYEMLFYTGAHNATQLGNVESYLKQRWGL